MALTGTNRGTATDATAGTTFAIVPASNFAANSFGVLCVAADNAGSGGATTVMPATITDSVGNLWTRRQNAIYDPGAASAGVDTGIYTAPISTLTTAANITITWAGAASVASQVSTLTEFVASVGVPDYVTGGVGTGAASAVPTVTTGSITSGDAVVGMGGAESGNTWVADADATNGAWSTMQAAAAGTGLTGMSITSQFKIVTGTATQTYNPTLTSADQILSWIQITELLDSGFPHMGGGYYP